MIRFQNGRNMNKNIITSILQSEKNIIDIEIKELEKLIKLFPYCEITRIIDLLFKKKSNDLLFEKKLSESIMHIHDREFLFFLAHKEKNKKNKEPLKKPLNKKQSFNEWLSKPINTVLKSHNVTKSPIKPKISIKNSDDLMTETLAKLYIEQKHFEQAIRAYEILSLKYPKKSSFFVREIEKIKQLILINDE